MFQTGVMGAIDEEDWVVGSFKEADDKLLVSYAGHCHGPLEKEICDVHINVREMWGVYAACKRWSSKWDNCSVMPITDSAVVQAALNMGHTRNKAITHYLHTLFWMVVQGNFEFKSIYIRRGVNMICDALSRLDS